MLSAKRPVGTYRRVKMPSHPSAYSDGSLMVHRLIAEAALGKPLPDRAQVHHVDRDRTNNARGNLVICQDHGYHFLLHQRQEALDACGNPNALRCTICKSYDRQEDISVRSNHGIGREGRHRSCMREEWQRRKEVRNAKRRAAASKCAKPPSALTTLGGRPLTKSRPHRGF